MGVSKKGVPQNGWLNPIKMEDLAVPLFLDTPILFEHQTNLVKMVVSFLEVV